MIAALVVMTVIAFTLGVLWLAAISKVGDLAADLRGANAHLAKLLASDANGKVSRGPGGRFVSAKG